MELTTEMKECFPDLANYKKDDFAKVAILKPTIMIAMTARSGSTHFCSALSSIPEFGEITEIFNPRGPIKDVKTRRNTSSFSEYMKSLGSDPTTYFVFKVGWFDFAYFSKYYKIIFPNLRVFYIDRFDIEAQALSLFRAKLTGNWHNAPRWQSKQSQIPENQLIRMFDLRAICQNIRELEIKKINWENFFFNEGLIVPRIHYEHFEKDITLALNYFFHCFNIPSEKVSSAKSEYHRISDKISEAWLLAMKQFRYAIKLPPNATSR